MYELFLADALKKRGVGEVRIHTLLEGESFEPLMQVLNASDGPVLFWESLSSKSVGYILNGMEFCKSFTSKTNRRTVLGGYWASTVAKDFPEFDVFDVVIQGYGFEQVVDCLLSDGSTERFVSASTPCDWNVYDMALDSLASPEKYYRARDRFLSGYISSFACPNKCGFCYNTVLKSLESDYASRDLDKVFADLEALDRVYGFERIQFKDLNFFHEKERALAILDHLKGMGKVCQRALDLHVSDASEELFEIVSKYGVTEIWIGLEAFTKAELDYMDKEYDTSKLARIFSWADKFKIEVYGNIMLGAPWQTKERVEATINKALDLIESHEYVRIMFNAMRPVLGSPIQKKYFADVSRNCSFKEMVDMFAFRLGRKQESIYGADFAFVDIEKVHKAFLLINRLATISLHADAGGKWGTARLFAMIRRQLKPPYFSSALGSRFFSMSTKNLMRVVVFLRTIFIPNNRKIWARKTIASVKTSLDRRRS
jgi:hypothetical protein